MKTKPYNRHETFLAALSDSAVTVPTPLTREERYLAKIAGETVTIPDAPYNRYETYLAKLAGQDVTVPTPASRLETFLYKACGYDCSVPIPANREEVFWKRYCGYDSENAMVSIDDAANEPVRNITTTIVARRNGYGVPSADNIIPLIGWKSVIVHTTKENLCGGADLYAIMKNSSGCISYDDTENTVEIRGSGISKEEYILNTFKPGVQYTIIATTTRTAGTTLGTNVAFIYDDSSFTTLSTGSTYPAKTARRSDASKTLYKLGYINATAKGTIQFHCNETGIMEGYHSVADFVPYEGKMYTVDITGAGTVYGGSLDLTNGILTVTHDVIASYNGEELPGAWISDRDVYTPEGTPTIGAQVVYELEEPEVYQITPTEVTTLAGLNNIWSDAGPVSVTYIPDL